MRIPAKNYSYDELSFLYFRDEKEDHRNTAILGILSMSHLFFSKCTFIQNSESWKNEVFKFSFDGPNGFVFPTYMEPFQRQLDSYLFIAGLEHYLKAKAYSRGFLFHEIKMKKEIAEIRTKFNLQKKELIKIDSLESELFFEKIESSRMINCIGLADKTINILKYIEKTDSDFLELFNIDEEERKYFESLRKKRNKIHFQLSVLDKFSPSDLEAEFICIANFINRIRNEVLKMNVKFPKVSGK